MKILVFSRHQAEHTEILEPHGWISIANGLDGEPNPAVLKTNEQTLEVLSLRFDDVEFVFPGTIAFCIQDARAILEFVKRMQGRGTARDCRTLSRWPVSVSRHRAGLVYHP